ncbi:MAG: NAD(P)H-dependent oxidoreductase [Nitrospiraceae bacterium]
MAEPQWVDVGSVEALRTKPVQQVTAGSTTIALSYADGQFGAIADGCNHVGGPLGNGWLAGEYVVCPWHYWKFHRQKGHGEPGFEQDQVPSYTTKIEDGRLFIDLASASKRKKTPKPKHPLARPIVRAEGPLRVLGLATTMMTPNFPRYSGSDALLDVALDHAKTTLGCETQRIALRDLNFRACEGYYSKSAYACTWPCSITQMDPDDQMDRVYEGLVHWADVILIATPIRWGNASSLYYRMVERLNCIQNQETIANKHLLKNKVAAFIIMGGQDNVQAVAGQLLTFFSEVGCQFPQFPFIGHSRGWSAEDMERNNLDIQQSVELKHASQELVTRAVALARVMVDGRALDHPLARGGRKAHGLDTGKTE